MFVVNLVGGLGNQMFQYAFGKSLSEERKIDVKFDLTDLLDRSSKKDFTYREFELQIFEANVPIASASDLHLFKSSSLSGLSLVYYKILGKINNAQWYNEAKYFEFDSQTLHTSYSTYFNGYWQNEKYFLKHEDVIRRDFTFKYPLSGLNENLSRQIKAHNAVSLHVRRGDYVANSQINGVHGICSLDYYQEAVNFIFNNVSDPHLYIFSDDPDWVRENMIFEVPTTYISHNNGVNSFEDMRLMSLCKHNIIANSSFSWWGAWLNQNPGKIVVAPKQWMQVAEINFSDLIPEKWVRL